MLARSWTGQDPTGWWMSEKYDGIRLLRPHGQHRVFTREGNPVNAPDWWLDILPKDVFLDGEAWVNRGAFQTTQRILQAPSLHRDWRDVKFMCIEPTRLWHMAGGANFHPIKQVFCHGREYLHEFYDQIIAGGGEGVVLRHPKQPYHIGRSPYLLKITPIVMNKIAVNNL